MGVDDGYIHQAGTKRLFRGLNFVLLSIILFQSYDILLLRSGFFILDSYRDSHAAKRRGNAACPGSHGGSGQYAREGKNRMADDPGALGGKVCRFSSPI